jgi:hypothetical protein
MSSPPGLANLIARSNAVAAAAAQAGDMFEPYVAIPVGSRADAVAIGDLNGDGLNDVALATGFDSSELTANDASLFVFLQDRSGELLAPRRYTVGGAYYWLPRSLDVGDLNGDGRDDVVIGRDGSVVVLLQNASGTLNPGVSYATSDWRWVRIGDFNSDRRNDVAAIASSSSPGGISIFAQQPSGSLALAARYVTTSYTSWSDPDVGDVNGDGREDLIVASDSYSGSDVFFYLQQPGGWLSAARGYDVVPNGSANAIGVGDVNGDGRDDVALGYGYSPARVATWLQSGAGAFGALSLPMPAVASAGAVEVADLDANGRKEVIVAHEYGVRIGIYWQATDGALSGEELYSVPSATSNSPQALAIGDINGDGVDDVVLANELFGLVAVPRNPARSAPSRPAAAADRPITTARVDPRGARTQ